MDAALRHLADHEIPDGHVVDVLIVRTEGRLGRIGGHPVAAVQNRPVLADKRIPGFRRDGTPNREDAGFQTEGGGSRELVHHILDVCPREDVDRAGRAGNRRLRAHARWWWWWRG